MGLPLFDGLDAEERARLRELAIQLLADKAFSGAGGIEVDDGMATAIAAFAALPVLNIGYDWYEGWREIVVYPGEYVYDGEQMDEVGVVHHVRHVRSGEAMQGGPMVLSWQDVEHSGQGEGFNVVIHEFAHKLDMKNGDANGRPPLHSGISPGRLGARFPVRLRRPLPPRGRRRRHGDRSRMPRRARPNSSPSSPNISSRHLTCCSRLTRRCMDYWHASTGRTRWRAWVEVVASVSFVGLGGA